MTYAIGVQYADSHFAKNAMKVRSILFIVLGLKQEANMGLQSNA